MELNGSPDKIPALVLGWDEKTQCVHLNFDNKQFRNWDFILAVLKMATLQAETQQKMSQVRAMQQQAMEQAAANEVMKKLR